MANSAAVEAKTGVMHVDAPYMALDCLACISLGRPYGGLPLSEVQYSIGCFQLFPHRRLLLDAGAPVRLGARAFDLLVALAERGGEVVSKADLIDCVWPNVTVDEVALRVHLSALRKALQAGNLGISPITSVPGRGYLLNVPVYRTINVSRALPLPPGRREFQLPSSGKRLIGRDGVAGQLRQKLRHSRFLSLVGPGGIGKTSVAIALAETAAEDYPDGVIFTDLAEISDSTLLWSAIAQAAHFVIDGENPQQALVAAFQEKRALLILDNCEHFVETAASVVATLRLGVPTLDIVATSREPLRAAGEWIHRLPPLEYPTHDGVALGADAIRKFSAVQLLVDRATASGDSFSMRDEDAPVAAELCRKLDGIPLAIELVASSIGAFGLKNVTARLTDWFLSTTRGARSAAPRHQTLNATLDWSFSTLPEREQIVLMQLAIFQGGMDLHMAVSIIAGEQPASALAMDAIYNLYEKSLIAADLNREEIEYRLLETTRAYALVKLHESGRYQEIARRHAAFFSLFFEKAEADWDALLQAEWLERYGRRIVDLRSALSWAFSDVGDLPLAGKLLADTGPLWFELGISAEYHNRLETIIEQAVNELQLEPVLDMRLKIAWAQSAWLTNGATPKVLQVSKECLRLAEELGAPTEQMQALSVLSDRNAFGGEEYNATERIWRLVETSPDPVIQLSGLRVISVRAHYEGDQRMAWDCLERMGRYSDSTIRQARRMSHRGDQKVGHAIIAARILWLRGYPDQALEVAKKGLVYAESLNNPVNLTYHLASAACPVAIWCGDRKAASEWAAMLRDVTTRHSYGFWHDVWEGFDMAIPRLGTLRSSSPGSGLPPGAEHRFLDIQLELLSTLHLDCVAPKILELCEDQKLGWCLSEALRAKALSPEISGQPGAAERLMRRSCEIAREQGALSWELRAATSLAQLLKSEDRKGEAIEVLEPAYRQFTEGFGTMDLVTARQVLVELRAI
jgi:predicted ATPase/DNA-binding winged helix-turn-helix (wHTH) protein